MSEKAGGRVLFLCTHNSVRSRMAEGMLRSLAGDRFEVASAGTEATSVKPLAMREVGVDISGHRSKVLGDFTEEGFEYVIPVCDSANEACPFFPNAGERLHWSFEGPSGATGSEEQKLVVFRRVRDEIRTKIEEEFLEGK